MAGMATAMRVRGKFLQTWFLVALGCAGGAPEAEEPAGAPEGEALRQETGGQGSVVEERPLSFFEALEDNEGRIRSCLGGYMEQHPEVEQMFAHISVSDCGRVVKVETVIGDEGIDECLLGVLEVVQLEKEPTCRDDKINKTYIIEKDLLSGQ
jgi:hypothetical protein